MKQKNLFDRVFSAFEKTTTEDVVRSLVTVLLVGGCIFLFVRDRQVPPELLTLTGMALGYFFGRVQTVLTGQGGRSIRLKG